MKKSINIPIFPLALVVLPGETESLHIFEPRYIKLVNEIFLKNKIFGIPFVFIDKTFSYGTTVHIKEITHSYPDGSMDILVDGLKVIRIESLYENEDINEYSTADINYLSNCQARDIVPLINDFNAYKATLQAELRSKFTDQETPGIFEIAKHLSLTELEKFELIKFEKSAQRMQYLRNKIKLLYAINKQADKLSDDFYLN
ncbi:MAG: LON peptidase substrate-binding domain-containing protein [Bacteroidales bacterium]|nr:LON peptidase substrate-binding domain-containing protein [Bacteroidales bacterium]